VAYYYFTNQNSSPTGEDSTVMRGRQQMAASDREAALQRLREHDPNFDEAVFLKRVRLAFDKIQAAWCAQNLNPIRPFISDGVYERFVLQTDEQKALGYRDHMEDISVTSIELIALATPGLFNEVSVRITAAARDWRQSLKDDRRISGSKGVEPFVEIWTFLRKRGAKSDNNRNSLIEGNCPNCGAPIEMNQSANCTHCKALLRSGDYDWVLTEITQQSEWRVRDPSRMAGVETLRERDEDFDTASIEDRASVMFWRKATADRTRKIDPLRKIALPDFVDRYGVSLQPQPNQPRNFAVDCAVGSVETLGVLSDQAWDRVVVEIRWSGTIYTSIDNASIRNSGRDIFAISLYVLARRADAKTDSSKAIASAHCPNCGAPESSSASNACEFCGTVLNDGLHGWVLQDIFSRDDPDGIALLRQMSAAAPSPVPSDRPTPLSARTPNFAGLLGWLIKLSSINGSVDPRDRGHIATFGLARGIRADQIDSMFSSVAQGSLTAPEPRDRAEATAWLGIMAVEAWADGKLSDEEWNMLCAMGTKAGLTEYDVKMLALRARRQMAEAASKAGVAKQSLFQSNRADPKI
jgi:hypothetical protein